MRLAFRVAHGLGRGTQVEVQVAIAKVAEGHRAAAGIEPFEQRRAFLDQRRDHRNGDGDVVLDRRTGAGFRLRHALADLPQGACLLAGLRDHAVLHQPCGHTVLHNGVDGIAVLTALVEHPDFEQE
ncbi:MAG: Uncharacterised protein [Rhodospirillaceae bacterium]|nr:MAG: Uncharacterised protein [Rhodospirillaceae bacterium]